jgi:hypothetical protein
LVVYPWEIYPYIFNDGIFCLSLVGCWRETTPLQNLVCLRVAIVPGSMHCPPQEYLGGKTSVFSTQIGEEPMLLVDDNNYLLLASVTAEGYCYYTTPLFSPGCHQQLVHEVWRKRAGHSFLSQASD